MERVHHCGGYLNAHFERRKRGKDRENRIVQVGYKCNICGEIIYKK